MADKKISFGIIATKRWVTSLIHEVLKKLDKNLINKPHLWEVGKEYDFGDNTYGQRFTGVAKTTTINTAASAVLDTRYPLGTISFIALGGITSNAKGSTDFAIPMSPGGVSSSQSVWMSCNATALYLHIVGHNANNIGDIPYDVWLLYNKK